MAMSDIVERLREALPSGSLLLEHEIHEDYTHDEALTPEPATPLVVVQPTSTAEVSAVLEVANELHVPVVARGSGTGLSGAAVPISGGILVSFERMNHILEIDVENSVAVVEPGVTLAQLDAELKPLKLVYPVFPGESSASIGGNVGTNAGGMRAIRYGVTRHHVLGLEVVLAGGEVIRCGGKFVKSSTGYDLTQLLIGSEGTLGLVTEATLKLHPRLAHASTLLAPFSTLEQIASAVPKVVSSGVAPLILEYIDMLTMASITASAGMDLGIPEAVRTSALAYLVVVLENEREDRLDEDVERTAELVGELGALDVYVLPSQSGARLISAREKAFFNAKAAGADDIIDAVVPRAAIPQYLARCAEIAQRHSALVVGCGHVGDGNVHLSVFQPDPLERALLLGEIFAAATGLGGTISGEHGIGTEKKKYFLALEDPEKIGLMRRIKSAFDPNGILGPHRLFDAEGAPQ
jgi:glycolate oxidase